MKLFEAELVYRMNRTAGAVDELLTNFPPANNDHLVELE